MLMNSRIASQLGMESRGHDATMLDQCGLARVFGEDSHAGSHAINNGPSDENHLQRLILQDGSTTDHVAGDLASIRIAEHRHIQQTQRSLLRILHPGRKQNRPGASSEDGAAVRGKSLHRVKQPLLLQKLKLCRALSTGKNQTVATFKIFDGAYLCRLGANFCEHGCVRLKIALYCQDADFQFKYSAVSSLQGRGMLRLCPVCSVIPCALLTSRA